jgi:phage terminase small subunit
MAKGEPSFRAKLYVANYLANGYNATQAAIAAGYSSKRIDKTVTALNSSPGVIALKAKMLTIRARKLEITAERVILEQSRIAYSDITEVVQWDRDGFHMVPSADMTEDTRATIERIEYTTYPDGRVHGVVKMYSKAQALKFLGRSTGADPDRRKPEAESILDVPDVERSQETLAQQARLDLANLDDSQMQMLFERVRLEPPDPSYDN